VAGEGGDVTAYREQILQAGGLGIGRVLAADAT
jgi:hypothetical protein